jgi:hypothetical protein
MPSDLTCSFQISIKFDIERDKISSMPVPILELFRSESFQ